MASRILRAGLVVLALAALALPAAGAPPPQPVSEFDDGFGLEGYGPDYPPTNATNVTVDVTVAANGTSAWTERATLTNPETVEAFRANESLRRGAVAYWFDHRFGANVTALRSELVGDTLIVTYRLDAGTETGPGGGVVFAPFAGYGNVYHPGTADVTFRPPGAYGVVSAPDAFVREGGVLRWNETTGPGRAGVSPGIVTFAPESSAFPGVLGWLATVGAFGAATLRLALVSGLVFGVPLGVLLSGVAAAVERRRLQVPALLAPALLGFVWVAFASFPATNPMPPFWPYGTLFALVAALPVVLGGVVLHVLARR